MKPNLVADMTRNENALKALRALHTNELIYLGEGQEGVVYRDNTLVYKVFIPINPGNQPTYLSLLQSNIEQISRTEHHFKIFDICTINNISILRTEYIPSKPLTYILRSELIDFLSDCWINKHIFKNVKKANFVRTIDSVLKFTDYELFEYSDNLFLNMCIRSFILLNHFEEPEYAVNKMYRSSINQFHLESFSGIRGFINEVFVRNIFKSSQPTLNQIGNHPDIADSTIRQRVNFNAGVNLSKEFYDSINRDHYLNHIEISNISINSAGYFEPEFLTYVFTELARPIKSVSLMIKACPQDTETLYEQVLHIVKQLSSPNLFLERVIAIDTREDDFLRQFTKKGSLYELLQVVNTLQKEGIINRYVLLPNDEAIRKCNSDWFDLECTQTHTLQKAPVTPQLYAFEQMEATYILQMDSDVIISRKDPSHSYLNDMIMEMENNSNVISVGFNICQKEDDSFIPYNGFENGGFVPEIRMGLFHKQRLLDARPLPNSIDKHGHLQLGWHRALHEKQKQDATCSIRGGDSRSFYIHPQNYRKTNSDILLTILDRAEQGVIPPCQRGEFDLAGSYYDWTIKKRDEALVVVCVFRNVDYSRFLRMWVSLVSQSFDDWGIVMIDDCSDNGLPLFIDSIIRPHTHKVTFIKNRLRQGGLANHYKAIHYFMSNPNSIVVTLDGDDALLGNDVLQKIHEKYNYSGADVVIGRMYRTDKLYPHYHYPVNFINPRLKGGNVWQHIRSFRKYLFDSLSTHELKYTTKHDINASTPTSPLKKQLGHTWYSHAADFAMMVPIIERSANPLFLDEFTYFHERTSPRTYEVENAKETAIGDILQRAPHEVFCESKDRKRFSPNTRKLEIDLTFDCNLKCFGCNRSCTQAPSSESMSFEQIKAFIEDSISNDIEWELINILGGEPTLHPKFEAIVHYISKYIKNTSPETVLQVVSNGYSTESREILERVSQQCKVIIDYASFKKDNKIEYFTPFNDAPIDDESFAGSDFSNGCWVTSYCGIGLNKYGYYACSVIGGIDRVMGLNQGIKSIDQLNHDVLTSQLKEFCRYCGNFSAYDSNRGDFIPRNEKAPLDRNQVSPTWKKIYKRYNPKLPALTEIY